MSFTEVRSTSYEGYINASFSNGSFDILIQGLQDDFNQSEASLNSTQDGYSLPGAIVTGALLSSIICMTISGNVLVLLAVFVNSHLRSTTNIFIVNLAVADLLLGTIVLPFSASKEIVNYWAFGQTFCDIWAAVDVLCCTASIMSLCVISLDRYIGVTRPLQHSSIMTEKRAILIVLAVWILSTAISVAPLVGWKEPPDQSPGVCTVTEQLGYVLFSVSWSFYIPLVIILLVYFRIYREALKQSKFLSTGIKTSRSKDDASAITLRIHTGRTMDSVANKETRYTSSSSSEHSESSGRKYHSRLTLAGKMAKFKREKKAAQTLGIVVGIFILCWFPFFFILPLGALCPRCYIPDLLFKVFFWLGYCNSMMNPIIYACSSREFKRAFKRILKCQFRRRPRTFLDHEISTATEIMRLSVGNSINNSRKRGLSSENVMHNNRWMKKSLSSNFSMSRRSSIEESPILPLRMMLDRSRRRKDISEACSDEEDTTYLGDASDEEQQAERGQTTKKLTGSKSLLGGLSCSKVNNNNQNGRVRDGIHTSMNPVPDIKIFDVSEKSTACSRPQQDLFATSQNQCSSNVVTSDLSGHGTSRYKTGYSKGMPRARSGYW
ncbi:alpha-1A adrenergic receptor-like [Lineus longissimus]|uniref:alpha-1A adrenergic receptor-like n=1 Tax=Lineus longissimus TaxID=88925 RepID=UPI002B4C881F